MTTADHAAFRSQTHHVHQFGPAWRSLMSWIAARRQRVQTERELSALSDRELRDLGIVRADIPRIARQAGAKWNA